MSEYTASPEKGTVADLSDARPQLPHCHQETMDADVEYCRQAIEHLKTRTRSAASAELSGFPNFIALDTASNIWVSPGFPLHAMQLAPLDNWAKFLWETGGDDPWHHQLRFDFRWQNTSDRPVVINTLGSLSFHGDCVAHARGPLFDPGDTRWCNLSVGGRLDINELWGQPIRQPSQFEEVLFLRASVDTPIWDGPDTQSASVDTGVSVWYTGYQVPPQGIVWIYLSCRMSASIRKGAASFNFKDKFNLHPEYKVKAHVVGIVVRSM